MLIDPVELKRNYSDRVYYTKIEKEIYNRVKSLGGIPIHIQNQKYRNGETEWIYTSESIINKAFKEAEKKYHGENINWNLKKIVKKFEDKTKEYDFKGVIYFDI